MQARSLSSLQRGSDLPGRALATLQTGEAAELTRRLLLAAAGVLVTAMVLTQITAPWNLFHNGWDGAFYSLVARTRLADGLANLQLPQALVTGTVRTPYLNHPPLTGLLVAVSYWIFGDGEAQTRLVGLIATSLSAVAFYKLLERAFSKPIAQIATLALITMPMFVVYADLVSDVGPVELLFLLGILLSLERYLAGHRGALVVGALCALFALADDYAVAFLVPALLSALTVAGAARRQLFQFTVAIAATIALSLGTYVAYVVWQSGSIDFLLERAAGRTGISLQQHYSIADWIGQMANIQLKLLSPFVVGTVILWLVYVLRRRRAVMCELSSAGWIITVTALVFGISYVVIGNGGAYAHDYWSYYLLPGYAIATGLAWDLAFRTRTTIIKWGSVLALCYAAIFTDSIGAPDIRLTSHPALALALATALAVLILRKKRYVPLIAFSAFICLNLLLGFKFRTAMAVSDRDMGATIMRSTQPGDVILTTGNAVPQQWYYSGRTIVPNSVGVGSDLPGWDGLLDRSPDLRGLVSFIQANAPIHLYLAEIDLYPNASVMAWLNRSCVYNQVTPRLVYIESCTL